MRIEYHPSTVLDLNSAVNYYNDLRPGLGDELRAEVYAAIEQIRSNPEMFATIENAMRRCLVHRFPYSVLYRIIDTRTVRVLVIRHHRRNPRFGMRRT
jgi:plasmid stabilization system protein ParE